MQPGNEFMTLRFRFDTKGRAVLTYFLRPTTQCAVRWMTTLVGGVVLLPAAPIHGQEAPLPAVTVGAGAQTSFVHDMPQGDSTDGFSLNSVRLYANGSSAAKIKFE